MADLDVTCLSEKYCGMCVCESLDIPLKSPAGGVTVVVVPAGVGGAVVVPVLDTVAGTPGGLPAGSYGVVSANVSSVVVGGGVPVIGGTGTVGGIVPTMGGGVVSGSPGLGGAVPVVLTGENHV